MVTTGDRFSHYSITGKLGEGGMGVVYRADDTKLKREVAIKVLPEAFARDEERMNRFEREAQVLASLNHPNIAAIYGLEEVDGVRALVLELVEGPTLAERIDSGALPLEEAVGIARQIAVGLEAAHEKGVVHRDLKPPNVKLTRDGLVKLLDFGLAKALASDGISGNDVKSSSSPTLTRAGTGAGVILGTAAYMSPEQAKGKPVDRRADIWAFGAVLFEMLSGERLFSGETASETLASVIKDEPSIESLPAETPPHIRRLLRRCLTKDPTERLQAIGEARIAIDRPSPEVPVASNKHVGRSPWTAGLALALAALVAGVAAWSLKPNAPRPLVRVVATPPSSEPVSIDPFMGDVAIAPDGSRIVYLVSREGQRQLMVRALDRLQAVPLGDSARGPFLSPDGHWVGYFTEDNQGLRKVSIHGGPPETITRISSEMHGGSWADDGTIILSTAGGLVRIAVDSGELEVLTTVDPEQGGHDWPEILPGGQAVLFTIWRGSVENAQIAVLSLKTRQIKNLVPGGSHPRYVSSGHIVYGASGTLRAVAFDLEELEVTSDPVTVLEGVVTKDTGAADFTVAGDGSLVYVEGAPRRWLERRLVWVDRRGREEVLAAPTRSYYYPRLSPDGRKLAIDVLDQRRGIWIWDMGRETLTRLTFDDSFAMYPVWTPDGRRIAFTNAQGLFWKAADGSGDVDRIETATLGLPTAFSPDGTRLVLRTTNNPQGDVGMLELEDGSVSLLVATDANERNADVSPDGLFVAYESNQSGRYEVYVRPFPDVAKGRWQVSRDGGGSPLWARNSRELFYMNTRGQVMAVPVQTAPGFAFGNAELVVDGPYFSGPPPGRPYDVSPDGQRFLMIREEDPGGDESAELIYVQNWVEELKRLVPTGR